MKITSARSLRSLEIIATDNKNAFAAVEADLKRIEREKDLAYQNSENIKEQKNKLEAEFKVNKI